MQKAFVAGWPISHSLSPLLHGYWLKKYGIEGSYEPVAVEPGHLREFLSGLPGHFAGGNITIPHKEDALTICDKVEPAAKMIGAVNTVWLEANRLVGDNTDAYGFAANLDHLAPRWREGNRAIVVGAGGASRAVIHAIMEAGYADICILNRTLARAEALTGYFSGRSDTGLSASRLDEAPGLLSSTDLLVNTTSLGMKGNPPLEIELADAKPGLIVTDIVYSPLETPLLKRAGAAGLATVDGLGMLLHQAVPGFQKWFGIRPQVDENLRQHVLAKVADKGRTG